MTSTKRFVDIVPYVLIMGAAVGLYYVADHIAYTAIPDQIGPDRWPKMIIGMLFFVCGFEIVRRLVAGDAARDVTSESEGLDASLAMPHTTQPGRVIGTIVVTVVYLFMLDFCGFFSSTIVYSACLMWLGGLHKPAIFIPVAVGLSFLFTFIFMKLIFVALPIGQGPFEKVSLTVMNLVGVH
jgi:putative tricarboxylic transport membrane protein